MEIAALASALLGKTVAEAQDDEELFLRFADGAILRVAAPFRLETDHHHSPQQAIVSQEVTGVRLTNGYLRVTFGPLVELTVDLRPAAPDALVLNLADGSRLVWK
jgi:hypothetical protein